ncbi:ABC transporter permease [Candidatus Uhrbacteria bacterium]|nr:ABC transporter permease [Candidatus Uhrbacteria bacterium]
MLRAHARIVKFALQNFFRNFWLSAVTIFILTLSFLTVNFFILANGFTDAVVQRIEDRITIKVYFAPSTQESDVKVFADQIGALPQVALVTYISKQQALDEFKSGFADQENARIEEALGELETNPLPSSVLISAHTVEDYPAILSAIDQSAYAGLIEKRSYDDHRGFLTTLEQMKKKIREAGTGITIFFALIIALIVYNTIRITIYSRRKEFGIMKLVGASNWFIRAPLILESIFYSLASLALTILILYPTLSFLQPYIARYFDGLAFDVLGYFNSSFVEIFGYQLASSLVLNILTSGLAIGRYLRV